MSRPTLSDATGKLRSKRRAATWKKLRWYVIGAAALIVIGVLVWLLWFSGFFVARQVRVEGASLAAEGDVVSAAQVPMGVPLIRIDTAGITARVLELPAVASATTTLSWPGTVTIVVKERVPLFQRADGAAYSWVDASGVVFYQTADKRADLPIALTTDADGRLLRDIAVVLSALSPELRKDLGTIAASSPDTISLKLSGGATIVWGSADRSALKSDVATALLKIKARLYDVSAPESPITRP